MRIYDNVSMCYIWLKSRDPLFRKSSIDTFAHCAHCYNMNKKDKAKHTKGQNVIPGVLVVKTILFSLVRMLYP